MRRRLCVALAMFCSLIANTALALDPDRGIAELQHMAWTQANGVVTGNVVTATAHPSRL